MKAYENKGEEMFDVFADKVNCILKMTAREEMVIYFTCKIRIQLMY